MASAPKQTFRRSAAEDDGLRLLELHSWEGPFAEDMQACALNALEQGHVLVFPHLAFAFDAAEHGLFTPALSDGKAKNVSLKLNGKLGGTSATGCTAEVLAGMMARFRATATRFLEDLIPRYRGRLEQGPTSYRPVEIKGRSASVIHDDTRLHIDAFPSRPMRGGRIMRLFTNVNPHGRPRLWQVGEPFEPMARTLGQGAKEGSLVHAAVLATLGVTKGRRSAYDSVMLALHDNAKRDETYQKECPRIDVSFQPGTTWLCFTDQVMHAAREGQYALEQTFHLGVKAMARPELSPLKILERLRGHALV